MSYPYSYALEKFSRAVYSLATGEEEIRRRLLLAFEGDLLCIALKHLPPQLRNDYRWITKQLTKFEEKYSGQREYFDSSDGRYDHLIPSKLEATLHRVRRATGARVAKKLFHIWSVLDDESRAF